MITIPRVLHVCGHFRRGGIRTIVESLLEQNKNYDSVHDLLLISDTEENEMQRYCRVHYLARSKRNFISGLISAREIFKNYDAFMIHTAHPSVIFPLLFSKKQIYLFQHGMSVRSGPFFKRMIKKLWFSLLPLVLDAKTICSTEFAFRKTRKLGILLQNKRNIIVPFGINTDNICKKNRDIRGKKIIKIGIANKLVSEKRNDLVLKSLYPYQGNKKINVKIAGDGPELAYLNILANRLDNGKVRIEFLGEISEMNSFYDKLDLFVLPSRDESFGLVVLEALIRYIPVVVFHDVGGCLALLDSDMKGFVIKNGIEGLTSVWNILDTRPEIIYQKSKFISKMNFEDFSIKKTRIQLDSLVRNSL